MVGKTTPRSSLHDFRYYYTTADIGLAPRLCASFLITYLDGFEGPKGDMERNTGLSDAWVSLKYCFKEGTYPIGRSLPNRGWANAEVGFTWREGAPANQTPFLAEAGYGLPWKSLRIKGSSLWVFSLGNDSPRKPEDRFGFTPGGIQNFNDASMGRLGVSLLVDIGQTTGLMFEVGYNQWVWGRSAREYKEPIIAFSRRI
ncbi:hypothetical protein L0337_44165 [candidate division KSB1 bacterium]|nr:hypothetical protein [candidate division KSB1 bacterium]